MILGKFLFAEKNKIYSKLMEGENNGRETRLL